MKSLLLLAPALLLALPACTPRLEVPVITERYVTEADAAMNIDSVATHAGATGTTWLFATAKEGHLLRIHDAASGAHLRDFGGPGIGPGEFQRPNGIIALDGLLVVIERDNQRVQILALPELTPLTVFGVDQLIKPYGGYLQPLGSDRYRLFVSDAYETANERVPPPAQLGRRVQVFDLEVDRHADGTPAGVDARHEQAFGATSGAGILYVVESLWGDPASDRLLIAEEDPAGGRVIKTYSLNGRFTGPVIGDGIFRSQPEGIALFSCEDGSGYWITTDQAYRQNVFHLFDRQTLAHLGGFEGAVTANTDGIWLEQQPLPGFPAGALFAVHDDQAVAAFDWRDIAAALELPVGCG
jgi:3-phytase